MDSQDENIIEFLKRVHTVCFGRDNRGSSFGPYKQVVLVKSLNNFSNNKTHDSNGFKEKIKIKFNAVKAVVEKFPNGTEAMTKLLKAKPIPLTWANYYTMSVAEQLILEERSDLLTKSMLFLMDLKNNNANKDLHLAYSQGNKTAYSLSVKAIARYMSTQYPNKNPGCQCNGKKGDRYRTKEHNPKSKEKDNNAIGTTGAHVGEVTTPEDSIAPSGRSSIGTHVSEATKQPS